MTTKQKRELIEKNNSEIKISRQAQLIGLPRSSVYHQPQINQEKLAKEKRLMDLIDKIYTDSPFYGARKIKEELKQTFSLNVGRHQVRKLMKRLGLEAIYPKAKRNFSQANQQHKKYPYLLANLAITHPNQVWGIDLTYVRLENGWGYLTAIMDWFSRYVLSWRLSNSLETNFCVEALQAALTKTRTEIFNSDQGSQFTAQNFTETLLKKKIKISMDGQGRYADNIFTERLWRTVKYENIYLKSYANLREANEGLDEYFHFYNHRRLHQSLSYRTPAKIYFNH